MKIIIYTTNQCASCKMVKRYLDTKSASYEVINLDDNPEEMINLRKATDVSTVPVTVLYDKEPKEVIIGFKPSQLADMVREMEKVNG